MWNLAVLGQGVTFCNGFDATFGMDVVKAGGEFGVFDFFQAFIADFGEPEFEGFGLWGGDGLDEAKHAFGVRGANGADLAVGTWHGYQGTVCPLVGVEG